VPGRQQANSDLTAANRPAGGQLAAGAGQTRCWFATTHECAAAARACIAFGRVPQRVVTLGPTSGCQGCCACSMAAGTTFRGVPPPRRGEALLRLRKPRPCALYQRTGRMPRIDGPAHRDAPVRRREWLRPADRRKPAGCGELVQEASNVCNREGTAICWGTGTPSPDQCPPDANQAQVRRTPAGIVRGLSVGQDCYCGKVVGGHGTCVLPGC